MDLYSSIKPAIITILMFAAVIYAVFKFFKKETRAMWIGIGIAAVLLYFIKSPQEALSSFDGLIKLVLNWISSLGG
ncbi:hypothetical protein WOSG25_190210 [Weissella oryzae SG25]|uniref:Uncharacterized protein n=1 Tax=Weissella oryzae (strain DSM 25784 / JCM 18191 / LMG 30913 / SG25) TaxID=1329250 RepID=A0A069CXG1_WEIOS|nr:TcpD family membrane protein [Weissella oryzae]GAK31913.1 hypothetical protein WOSG25_190210 [Weissella oryzae SG25]